MNKKTFCDTYTKSPTERLRIFPEKYFVSDEPPCCATACQGEKGDPICLRRNGDVALRGISPSQFSHGGLVTLGIVFRLLDHLKAW